MEIGSPATYIELQAFCGSWDLLHYCSLLKDSLDLYGSIRFKTNVIWVTWVDLSSFRSNAWYTCATTGHKKKTNHDKKES